MVGDVFQEEVAVRVEDPGAAVEDQTRQRILALADGGQLGDPVVGDRVILMAVDVGEVGGNGGAAGVEGAVGHFQGHVAALGQGCPAEVGGIGPEHRPVALGGQELVAVEEVLGDHDLASVLAEDLNVDVEGVLGELALLDRPRHGQRELGDVGTEIGNLDVLIVDVAHRYLLKYVSFLLDGKLLRASVV